MLLPLPCRLPLPALRRAGALTLRTDLTDAHCYVFDRSALLAALEARPLHSSLKQVADTQPAHPDLNCSKYSV
jgi:hypothetical protein